MQCVLFIITQPGRSCVLHNPFERWTIHHRCFVFHFLFIWAEKNISNRSNADRTCKEQSEETKKEEECFLWMLRLLHYHWRLISTSHNYSWPKWIRQNKPKPMFFTNQRFYFCQSVHQSKLSKRDYITHDDVKVQSGREWHCGAFVR